MKSIGISRIFVMAVATVLSGMVFTCLDPDIRELDFVVAVTGSWKAEGVDSVTVEMRIDGIEGSLYPADLSSRFGIVWSTVEAVPTLGGIGSQIEEIPAPLSGNGSHAIMLSGLTVQDIHYYRAFVEIGDRLIYGETNSFSLTENLQIRILEDQVAVVNDQIAVEAVSIINFGGWFSDHGFIFSSDPEFPGLEDSTKVLSLGESVNDGLFSAVLEGLEFETEYFIWAYGVYNGIPYFSDQVRLAVQGGWKFHSSIENLRLQDPVGASYDGRAVIALGCGFDGCSEIEARGANELYAFDPSTDRGKDVLPVQRPVPAPTGRIGSAFVQLADQLYVGLGRVGTDFAPDFWVLDMPTFTWSRLPDYPGAMRRDAIGFTDGERIYIGSGSDTLGVWLDDFWSYDPQQAVWEPIAPLPIMFQGERYGLGRTDATAFVLDGRIFAGLGDAGGQLLDIWEYLPDTDEWSFITEFADLPGSDRGPISVVVGDAVYLGLSNDRSNYRWFQWRPGETQTDPMTAAAVVGLVEQQSLPYDANFPLNFYFAFEISGRGYVIATNSGRRATEIWEFAPNP